MKGPNSILHYSLFIAIIGGACAPAFGAGVRAGDQSRSYAGAYNQVNAMRQQEEYYNQQYGTTNTDNTLPVRVANLELANQILAGDTSARVNKDRLESCAAIYPDGEFAWDRPTGGMGANGAETCVAVVEMRGYQMGPGGSDLVLARANVAAGDAIKCNISEFPSSGYTADAGNITFPADAEPTMSDVTRVMNDEQKKNAGLKIAANTLLFAVAGNLAGDNEPGRDGLFGTGKKKMNSTLVGALGGAAIGTGNAYAGKVGGDMILSTGVNMAAGAAIGNMMGTGDPVLRVEDCTVGGANESCVWGTIITKTDLDSTKEIAYYNLTSEETLVCDTNGENCQQKELIGIRLAEYPTDDLYTAATQKFTKITNDASKQYHAVKDPNTGKISVVSGRPADNSAIYAEIKSAGYPQQQFAALVPGVRNKAFGLSRSYWITWRNGHKNATVYGRGSNGEPYDISKTCPSCSVLDFYPLTEDASDGSLIDLGNRARMKSTLVGAGVGGAMGAFTAYQGAQKDINDRWVSAVREYKDSLQKVYCVTGKRFLSYYNDISVIPQMVEQ